MVQAIEEDVDRLSSERELKQRHLDSLEESLKNYESELEEREAQLYEVNDAIEEAKRVHQAGQERDRLQKIEDAARAAGKNVGIDGVGAAQSLRELVNAVKRNQEARRSARPVPRQDDQDGSALRPAPARA